MSFVSGPPPSELPPDVRETPPATRRGPGRPRGSTNRRSTKSLRPQIASTLMAMNLVVYLTPFNKDALDEVEIEALATALDEQAKQSPAFRRYLQGALGVASGGQLFGVLAIIGARRAARHGFMGIPAEADGQMRTLLQVRNVTPTPPPTPASATETATNGVG